MAGFVFWKTEAEIAAERARAARVHAGIAAARMRLSGAQLCLLLKNNFNPNQPRVPAGQPGGGKWTNGGGLDGDYVQVAQNAGAARNNQKPLTEAEIDRMRFASDAERVAARGAARKPFVLSGKGSLFWVTPNASANSNAPLNEIPLASGVDKYNGEIEDAAKKERVDPDLIRTIVYVETTHGWYDALAMGRNDTILPMNVSVENWGKSLGLSRSDLEKPAINIEAGTKILKGIIGNLPDKAPVSVIATLYNVLGAPQVNNYGARAQKIFQIRPWKKQ